MAGRSWRNAEQRLILVDSSVWIDYFKGISNRPMETLDHLLSREPLAVGDLILTEVLQAFSHGQGFDEGRKFVTSLTVIEPRWTGHRSSSGTEFQGTAKYRHYSP